MSDGQSEVETAGVALVRRGGRGLEVLLARRPDQRSFLPGFHGFVVGRVRESDRDIPLEPTGPYRAPSRAHWGCAVRELFEEFGLLALTDGWIRSWSDRPPVEAPEGSWSEFRERVAADEVDFAAALRRMGLVADVGAFHPVGGWSTPQWASLQTTTEFFTAEGPAFGDRVLEAVDAGEHREPVWVTPVEAVERWRTGEWFLSTPIRLTLQGLVDMETTRDQDLLPSSDQQSGPTREMIEVLEGVRMLPLATPTIPPATHTNSYIVGKRATVLVDPGSAISREQSLLREALEELNSRGVPLRAVVLTHHHSDHVGGVPGVLERFDAQILAHPETARRLPEEIDVDRELEDGETIDVEPGDEHRLRVYHTPGHSPGHISLVHSPSPCLIAGDLVASRGTILIDPPEGDMGQYLESLARINQLELAAILPAHGTVVSDPHARIDYYLVHRRERERKVLRALQEAGRPVEPRDLIEDAYRDTPPEVWPLAVRSLHAHLIHLVKRSMAVETEDGFVYDSSSTKS